MRLCGFASTGFDPDRAWITRENFVKNPCRRALLGNVVTATATRKKPDTEASQEASGSPLRDHLLRGAHLLVLWTFALPQPTFSELNTPSPGPIKNAGGLDLVLFAVGYVLIPPAIMLLVEVVASRLGPRILKAVHLLFVGTLAAIIASPIVYRLLDSPTSKVQSAAALVAGAVFALGYAKLPPIRSMATVLTPAPLIFVLIFLFTPPISNYVLGRDNDYRVYPTAAKAPIVFVVFDEFNSNSLMTRDGKLDAARYPNFARLARNSTWFRNAMADHSFTDIAVPTLLMGRSAPQGNTPHVWDDPNNLFTMLGGYKVHAVEQVTDLCPEKICPERGSFPGRLPDLYKNITVLGLDSVMPDAIKYKLPQVELYPLTPGDEVSQFMGGIKPSSGRTLNFGHIGLPHMIHNRLPSGKLYPQLGESNGRSGGPGGVLHWEDQPWLVDQGFERYMLQVEYTDKVLGEIIAKLKRNGLYDKAAIVVTADHGVAHNPGDDRRAGTRSNLEQIMPVPLFVKAPHERAPRVINRHIQTVDFLPTLADVLGVRVPYRTDGRSGFDPTLDRKTLSMTNLSGPKLRISAAQVERRRAAQIRRQVRLFGEGGSPDRIYEIGLTKSLWGRSVASLPHASAGATKAIVRDPSSFAWDPRKAVEPARVFGQVTGPGAKPGTRLLIAMNGRIRTETETYGQADQVRFSSMLPPAHLRAGRNSIEVLALSGSAAHPRVELLATAS
jgi:Sulfatase